jgi:multicomponent Na+:H+ antiporter subunit D
MTSSLPVLPFAILFMAALASGLAGWFVRPAARWIALAALAGTTWTSLQGLAKTLAAGRIAAHMGGWAPPLGIEWALDPLGALMAVMVSVGALIVLGAGGAAVRAELEGREPAFYVCSLLLLSGLMGMACSADLFNLFVHLEVASLSAYALVAAGGPGAPRAAIRYLVIGSLGASFYLLGVGYLYAATGTLNLADVAARLPSEAADKRLTLVALLFIGLGLSIKMGLFPMHGWMPAAYSRSPAAAAALMAPLVTKVCAYVAIRVLFWVYGADSLRREELLLDALAWGGAAAVMAGSVLALVQTDLRRLLAYSSVSQMGIVAIGMGIANGRALTGSVLHILNDAAMKGALFLVAAALAVRFGVREVEALARLRGRVPWAGAALLIAGLSLVGVPPLGGFFGKWYVLSGAIEAGRPLLAAAIALGSLLSAAYVFRLIEQLFFGFERDAPALARESESAREGAFGLTAGALVFAALVVALGLANERLVSGVISAALPGGLLDGK